MFWPNLIPYIAQKRRVGGPFLPACGVSPISSTHMPPYLTWIEGPPPKRDVVRSSRAGGANKAIAFNYGSYGFIFLIHFIIPCPLPQGIYDVAPLRGYRGETAGETQWAKFR